MRRGIDWSLALACALAMALVMATAAQAADPPSCAIDPANIDYPGSCSATVPTPAGDAAAACGATQTDTWIGGEYGQAWFTGCAGSAGDSAASCGQGGSDGFEYYVQYTGCGASAAGTAASCSDEKSNGSTRSGERDTTGCTLASPSGTVFCGRDVQSGGAAIPDASFTGCRTPAGDVALPLP